MRNPSERSSDAIVSDIERTRADIDRTLSAIEQRLTPGQLVDQGIAYLRRSNARQFASNFGGQVRDNPLPVALVGIGLAWLMASGHDGVSRSTRYGRRERLADRAEDMLHDASDVTIAARARVGEAMDGAADAADSARERVSDAIDDARERASGTARAARERVSDALGRATDKARSARESIGRTTESARERARDLRDGARHGMERARDGYGRLVDEQPLALGLFGLAVGALLAATVPRTRGEDRVMGEASDRIADRAREAAEAGLDKASHLADRAREAIGEEDQRDAAWREPVPAGPREWRESMPSGQRDTAWREPIHPGQRDAAWGEPVHAGQQDTAWREEPVRTPGMRSEAMPADPLAPDADPAFPQGAPLRPDVPRY